MIASTSLDYPPAALYAQVAHSPACLTLTPAEARQLVDSLCTLLPRRVDTLLPPIVAHLVAELDRIAEVPDGNR